MNIKILDSWLRDYVKTNATPKQIAEHLSLSSVSVERLEKYKQDYLYDIEITTNRPDLMSVVGLARETAAILKQNNIAATFISPKIEKPRATKETSPITIKNDPKLVNRVCAVVMEVTVKPSPKQITERLESTDIRSLNNIIDITNYVMRVIGHPTHVFDYDRLATKQLTIKEAKPKQKIMTLDKKEYTLPGGDIVAINDKGDIVDLMGIMGLENSVVTENTKRILFFIDNNDPHHMRKTSMSLGIRTEAAVLNEKAIDPELAWEAFLFGIKQFETLANGKVVSQLIDIYPNKIKPTTVTVSEKQINTVIGVSIPLKKASEIITSLGFETKQTEDKLIVTPPSFRANDFGIPEDVIEEIARVYGYHNIPDILPPASTTVPVSFENDSFYWEDRVKDALKYWGFTEVYTYPMVSENLYEGPLENAVTIQNPLTEEFVYMRQTLVPSLLKVVKDNKDHESLNLFEISNVYIKKVNDLPEQQLRLAGVMKKPRLSFYEAKGIIEQLFIDLGITDISFTQIERSGDGAKVFVAKEYIGDIEILDKNVINFEFEMQRLVKHATLKKKYKPVSKYPPVLEDLALVAPANITTGEIIETIKKHSKLIQEVSLLDKYQETRTFHIIYQSNSKNLTDKEVGEIRESILKSLKDKYKATLRE